LSGDAALKGAPTRKEAVEVIARLCEAINHGRLDQLLKHLDAGVEFCPLPLTARRRCRGQDAVLRWLRELQRSGLEPWFEIDETRSSVEGDCVLAGGSVEVSGVRAAFVAFHRLRDGRVTVVRHYFSDLTTLRTIGHSLLRGSS
jgi:ketosteroid isomerase-like protein